MKDYSVFADLATKYAQQNLNPQDLQIGQQIYGPDGKAMQVIEDPTDTTTKTLMPVDQQGSQTPQGVETVEDTDLAAQYNLQPPNGTQPATGVTPATTAKRAQEEDLEVNWNDLQDIVQGLTASVQKKDMRGVVEALEDLTEMVFLNVNMPSDMKMSASNMFKDFVEEYKHG